jgi:transcriptional regulator with XRE-family HTH domain
MKRPRTRVEEIRIARGLSKAELARRAQMPPPTLQRIEDGNTKTLSFSARSKLTKALQVRDDELLAPIGTPFRSENGAAPPVNDLIYAVCLEILDEMRKLNAALAALTRPGRNDDS